MAGALERAGDALARLALAGAALVLFGLVSFDLPAFRTTLTAEDSSGSQSN